MEHRIGSHKIFIKNDTVLITLIGNCDTAHIREIIALVEQTSNRWGRFFVLADVSSFGQITPEARRVAGEWSGIARAAGTVIIGASVMTRAIVILVSRASTLLSHTSKKGELAFCANEQEAVAWLKTRGAAGAKDPSVSD